MNCLHPFTRKYKDPITGELKEVVCPCGHCINCLHAEQDAWTVRLQETAKIYKQMVYDTLTIRPSAMHTLIDFKQPTKDNTFWGSTRTFRHWRLNAFMKSYTSAQGLYPRMSKFSWYLLKKNNFVVPYFPKDEVQRWLKRGREAYKRDHEGQRVDVAYFIVQEYGPQTSRPHFHVLMFGINLSDYKKYFGNPWNADYGFTRPTWKCYSPWEQKAYTNIVRYVAKYVCKGDFVSPWVKDLFAPKPYRLISKGIGAGYENLPKFDVFKKPEFTRWLDVHCPSEETYKRKCVELLDAGKVAELDEYRRYYAECRRKVDDALALRDKHTVDSSVDYVDLNLTENDVKALQIYYDSSGFPHKLPTYYKNKLFRKNNEKNIYQLEIQDVLQQSARLHDNKIIQREALEMGIIIPDSWCERDSSTWKLPSSTLFMIMNNHNVKQLYKAKTVGERRYSRLTNFYNRSKMNTLAPALA